MAIGATAWTQITIFAEPARAVEAIESTSSFAIFVFSTRDRSDI